MYEQIFMEESKMEKNEKEEENQTEITMDVGKPARIAKAGKVKLLIKDETYETYANGLTVLHVSPMEFRLNFYDASFGDEEGRPIGVVKSTVTVSPELIRPIIKALETNLKSYEDKFGKIEERKAPEELLAKMEKFEGEPKK